MQTAAEFTLAIIIKGAAENFFRRAFTVIMAGAGSFCRAARKEKAEAARPPPINFKCSLFCYKALARHLCGNGYAHNG